jgi:hypothetical protein
MEFVLHLDEPDADLRHQLWERELGSRHVWADNLGVVEIAGRYDISGGLIRNAAEAAMYVAAGRRGP